MLGERRSGKLGPLIEGCLTVKECNYIGRDVLEVDIYKAFLWLKSRKRVGQTLSIFISGTFAQSDSGMLAQAKGSPCMSCLHGRDVDELTRCVTVRYSGRHSSISYQK
jgi:hypothetical protein